MIRVPRRHRAGAQPFSVLPLMNLFSMLVPMLLMASQFVRLAVVRLDPASAGVPAWMDRPPPITLWIDPAGLTLTGLSAVDPGAPVAIRLDCLDDPTPESGCAPDRYDLGALRRRLVALKAVNPLANRILLAPAPGISYDAVIRILDAVRLDDRAPLFDEALIQDRGL